MRAVAELVLCWDHNTQGMAFTSLPANLTAVSRLQVFDLSGNTITGGVLPGTYGAAWPNLTAFQVRVFE